MIALRVSNRRSGRKRSSPPCKSNSKKPRNQNPNVKKGPNENAKSITVLRKKKIDGAYWRGSQVDIILGIHFLKNKYKNIYFSDNFLFLQNKNNKVSIYSVSQ